MKAFRNIICIFLIYVGLTSCSKDELKGQKIDFQNNVKKVSATVTDFGAISRSELYRENNEIKFKWTLNDTLGIFPDKGSQAYFAIENVRDGGLTASFNGGGWALKLNHTYSAYFPFINDVFLESNNILLDYTGQEQTGNNSYSHIGKYDFLASDALTPIDDNLNLTMKHLGSVIILKLRVDEPGDFISCSLIANNDIFTTKAVLDISGSSPTITPVEKSNTITLILSDVKTTENNEDIILSMILLPVDLSDQYLKFQLCRSDGVIIPARIENPQNLEQGKASEMSVIFDKISFSDNEVKSICLANWDSDGDGELSFEEAAAVTSIDNNFTDSKITSFNEFKFFTGITKIPSEAFLGCLYLESIEIPNSVNVMEIGAFNLCESLEKLIIPRMVSYIPAITNCCYSLSYIEIHNPRAEFSYYGTSFEAPVKRIEVPAESVEYYKSVLKDYSDIIFALGDDGDDGGDDSNNGYSGNNEDDPDLSTNITFAESSVKIVCIANWDFNNDGELSYAEASAVTSIGTLFKGIGIKNFEEFQYFSGITSIPNNAFDGYNNSSKTLVSIILPESIVSIGEYAFRQQTSLTTITIPQNVTSIGMQAFAGCGALKTIYFKSATPPTYGSDAVPDIIQKIYVPAGSVNSYKAAFPSKFANKIVAGNY